MRFIPWLVAPALLCSATQAWGRQQVPPPPDSTRLAVARSVVELSQHSGDWLSGFTQLMGGAGDLMELANPGIMEALATELRAIEPALKDSLVLSFARHFTTEELRELERFYRSSTGQRFLAFQPTFTAEMGRITEELLFPRLERVFGMPLPRMHRRPPLPADGRSP